MISPPKPSAHFKKLQRERRALLESGTNPERRIRLEQSLEEMFVAAWSFAPDRLRLGYKLGCKLRGRIWGFDHCNHYTTVDDQCVIVTQPYGDFTNQLRTDLTLDGGVSPEIFDAPEWAFYYPGRASLVVLVFPSNFAKSFDDCLRRREQECVPAILNNPATSGLAIIEPARATKADRAQWNP